MSTSPAQTNKAGRACHFIEFEKHFILLEGFLSVFVEHGNGDDETWRLHRHNLASLFLQLVLSQGNMSEVLLCWRTNKFQGLWRSSQMFIRNVMFGIPRNLKERSFYESQNLLLHKSFFPWLKPSAAKRLTGLAWLLQISSLHLLPRAVCPWNFLRNAETQ